MGGEGGTNESLVENRGRGKIEVVHVHVLVAYTLFGAIESIQELRVLCGGGVGAGREPGEMCRNRAVVL